MHSFSNIRRSYSDAVRGRMQEAGVWDIVRADLPCPCNLRNL